MRHYRSIAFALAASAAFALFASLGAWQWSRAAWKEDLLAERAAVLQRRQAQPLAVAFDAARRNALEWTAGRGRFDGRRWFLDNQQRDGRPGLRLYGALETPQGPLLVELGWLPWGARRELPDAPLPPGEVEVSGVLIAPPSSGLALGNGAQLVGSDTWLLVRMELATLQAISGGAPFAPRVLKLDPVLPLGYARDFELLPNTLPPERHRGYAVQWWGLAATVAIVYVSLTVRAARRRKPAA